MALQFDGAGKVSFSQWVGLSSETWSVTLPTLEYSTSNQVLMGRDFGTDHFIAFLSGVVRVRASGSQVEIGGLANGSPIDITISCDGANITLDVNGNSAQMTSKNLIIDVLGSYNSGSLPFSGLMPNLMVFTGGTNDRSYDFEQTQGDMVLPDSISGQDGTLSGFTSGGFLPPSTPEITVDPFITVKNADDNLSATFSLSGTCSNQSSISYSVDNGLTWSVLDAAPTLTWSGTVPITGQVNLKIREDDTFQEVEIQRVTAAFVILLWFQSNEAGRGLTLQTVNVGAGKPTPLMYKEGVVSTLADPTGIDPSSAGSIGLAIGKHYSDLGIPVCIVNVAQGGSSINYWQKGQTGYDRIEAAALALGGYSLSSCIGGETDQAAPMPINEFKSKVVSTCDNLLNDYNVNHYLTKFPTINDSYSDAFDELVAENNNVKFGGDLRGIPTPDGVHIQNLVDINEAGQRRFAAFNSSNLVITVPSIGNQTRDFDFYNNDLKTFINTHSVTFTNDEADISLPVSTGTVVVGHNITADTLADGVPIYGVTVDV